MSVDVHSEVVISQPKQVVGEFMFNPKCEIIWMTGLTKVFPQTAGALTRGARVEHIGDFLGRRFSRNILVTNDRPYDLLEMAADEPFEMKIRYELSDADGGTKVKIRIQSVADLNFPMPASTVAKAVQDKITADLKKLKKHLEENSGE